MVHAWCVPQRTWTRACECEKEMDKIYLDGSAFTIIFLRAKQACATMLYIQFWTHVISFNIDLWLMNPGTQSVNFLVENGYLSLNCLNRPYWVCPCSIFRKKIGWNRWIWPKNGILYHMKFIFQRNLVWLRWILKLYFM